MIKWIFQGVLNYLNLDLNTSSVQSEDFWYQYMYQSLLILASVQTFSISIVMIQYCGKGIRKTLSVGKNQKESSCILLVLVLVLVSNPIPASVLSSALVSVSVSILA